MVTNSEDETAGDDQTTNKNLVQPLHNASGVATANPQSSEDPPDSPHQQPLTASSSFHVRAPRRSSLKSQSSYRDRAPEPSDFVPRAAVRRASMGRGGGGSMCPSEETVAASTNSESLTTSSKQQHHHVRQPRRGSMGSTPVQATTNSESSKQHHVRMPRRGSMGAIRGRASQPRRASMGGLTGGGSAHYPTTNMLSIQEVDESAAALEQRKRELEALTAQMRALDDILTSKFKPSIRQGDCSTTRIRI